MNINEVLKSDYDLLCKEYKKAIKKIEKLEKQKEYLTTQQLLEELQKRLDFDANVSEELASESNELQSRIDKAIEKLKEHKQDLDYEPWSIYQIEGNILFDLVDILKGSDSNE